MRPPRRERRVTPSGPLARRIAARKGQSIAEAVPKPAPKPATEPWRPVWLRNLTARDETGRVLS